MCGDQKEGNESISQHTITVVSVVTRRKATHRAREREGEGEREKERERERERARGREGGREERKRQIEKKR